jgi:preprotein translocase subunit SecD
MQLVARTRFFGEGHRLSGLDPDALGAVYRGRAQFRAPVAEVKGAAARRTGRSRAEAERRQTIAERKLQSELAARGGGSTDSSKKGAED